MIKELLVATSRNLAMLIAAVAIFVIALGWYARYQNVSYNDVSTSLQVTFPRETVPGQIPQEGMLVSVLDVGPQFAGDVVYLDFAELTKPGFAVIHENASGKPGKVIGVSALLPGGEVLDALEVKASLMEGRTYLAMLHIDNGDKMWHESQDPPFYDETGGPVMVTFPAESLEDGFPPLYPEESAR